LRCQPFDVLLEAFNASRKSKQFGDGKARTATGQQSQRPVAPAGKTHADYRPNQR
jgi:hypothetical protein